MKHILPNKFGSKHSPVMKFGQFIYYKRKIFIKKLYETYGLETSSGPFLIFKESPIKRNLRRTSFINRLCLLPKLLSKIYFLFYAWALDEVMKFEYLKF